MFTRRAVGWLFSTSPDADSVVKVLIMVFEQRGRPAGLMFHNDQSGQGRFNWSSQHAIIEQTLGIGPALPQVFPSQVSCVAEYSVH